jgi:metal-sulfur cluster biosynthetic enzyme
VTAAVVDEALVRSTLNEIVDPCSAAAGALAGLDDMGLVRSVEISETASGVAVKVKIGVTEPGCFMIYPFAKEARKRLDEIDAIDVVEVDLDNGHDWMPTDMSERYRRQLAEKRAVRGAALADLKSSLK